jgi:hypothetical protein
MHRPPRSSDPALLRPADQLRGAGRCHSEQLGGPVHELDLLLAVLDGVDVHSTGPVTGAVVALGDSITDGFGPTIGANRRWPNDLARYVAARRGNDLTAIDAGIVGQRPFVS